MKARALTLVILLVARRSGRRAGDGVHLRPGQHSSPARPPERSPASAGIRRRQPEHQSVLRQRAAGTATPEPLSLSVKDAVQRALRNNLGLLLQEESASAARRRALARAGRSAARRLGRRQRTPAGHQPRGVRLPREAVDRRAVQRLRRARVPVAAGRRRQRAQRLARRDAERAGGEVRHQERARPRRAGRGEPLSRSRRGRQPRRDGARAAGDGGRAVQAGAGSEGQPASSPASTCCARRCSCRRSGSG